MIRLPEEVTRLAAASGILPHGSRILVGVSGGVDSMVLLHLLQWESASRGWTLTAAHLNHGLRGRSSEADERFVRAQCRRLEMSCAVGHRDVRSFAARHSVSIEMAAREVRHRFLAETARRRRCTVIALAHQADDQSELVLMRLLRGAGSEGLGGMSRVGVSPVDAGIALIRPLLGVRRDEILHFAHKRGIAFREDRSTTNRRFLRNRIRHELLPLIRESYQPAVDEVLIRTASMLSAEAECIRTLALDWLGRRSVPFDSLPLAVRRRVVHCQLIGLGVAADFETCEKLLEEPGRTVSVPGGGRLSRDAEGTVHPMQASGLRHRREAVVLDVSRDGTARFGGRGFRWRVVSVGRQGWTSHAGGRRESFDASAIGDRVRLRHWRAGDRFHPIGMGHAVKLQDLFTNLKVPAGERRNRVVAEAESGEVFWVEGLRIGERFKLGPASRKRLDWRWTC